MRVVVMRVVTFIFALMLVVGLSFAASVLRQL